MVKRCEIDDNKICDGCGECDICDLDPSKKCTNCGKCIEGFDYTGIQIDDLLMDDSECIIDSDEWKFDKKNDENNDNNASDDNIVFIDDIEGLREEIEAHEHEHDIEDAEHEHVHGPECGCEHEGEHHHHH